MNHYAIQQNSFAAAFEEVIANSSSASVAAVAGVYRSETVVCPKPRRLGLLHSTLTEPSCVRPLRWNASHHQEVFDSKAGNELLDIIILAKGERGSDRAASPPPFLCGSPPSRASNPLIQDARFGDESPSHPIQTPSKGACIRSNFGNNPAVRVEGFDCDRRCGSCSIPALA